MYDEFVEGKGVDKDSQAYDSGDDAAEVVGWLSGVRGLFKSLGEQLVKKGEKKAAKEAEVPSPSCTRCFLAGTDVEMADGSTKDIEGVEVGDEVLATDPETGESGARKVTRLIITDGDKHFNELSIATEDGVEHLTATYEHPFWSPSEQAWIKAGDLTAGMALLTDEGGTVVVTGNRAYTDHVRTYNLTVDGLHTYYVLAGETPVLVHNSEGCPDGVDDVWHEGTFENPAGSFEYHWKKHGEPLNIAPEKYLQDSNDWAKKLAEPGGKKGYNAKRMPFDDGKWGVKYSDPGGGKGGIIGPNGRVVSFWYDEAH